MKKLIANAFSRPIFQTFFESVLRVCLKAMNIGEGQSVETSGERSVFSLLERVMRNSELPPADSLRTAMIFDIGAHTGEWASLFKKTYKGPSIVHSFEPSKESFNALCRMNLDGWMPHNVALGEAPGFAILMGDSNGSSGAHISQETNASVGMSDMHQEDIRITTLDQFCAEHGISNIDLLKLDIEGYELRALAGAREMISRNSIKLIQFEYGAPSDQKYSLKDFFDILGARYVICRILKHGYYPLPTYAHHHEIMTVTNFIAIRKDIYK